MKHPIFLILSAASLCLLSACDEDYLAITNPDAGSGRKAAQEARAAYLNSGIDWTGAADSVSSALVERFYCSTNRGGVESVFSYSEYNNRGGNFNCYWQQAHAMAAMVDWHNRIKESNPTQAALLREYMSRWYDKRGNNYEGNAGYCGSTGFGNNFRARSISPAWNSSRTRWINSSCSWPIISSSVRASLRYPFCFSIICSSIPLLSK